MANIDCDDAETALLRPADADPGLEADSETNAEVEADIVTARVLLNDGMLNDGMLNDGMIEDAVILNERPLETRLALLIPVPPTELEPEAETEGETTLPERVVLLKIEATEGGFALDRASVEGQSSNYMR